MLYHYIFRTYKGKQLLEDKEIRRHLTASFNEIAAEKGFLILGCGILSDHVHILIEQAPSFSTSVVMKYLKGISSRKLLQAYRTNRCEIRKLWGRSFNAREIGDEEKQTVLKYIKNQRNRNGIDKRY